MATIAILLPMTYALEPLNELIMLAGIYYGAQYGGSTTAILINLPCEASSVLTALDGFVLGPMLEENFRRCMQISRGSLGIFVTEPISAAILAATAIIVLALALPKIRRKRDEVFAEE